MYPNNLVENGAFERLNNVASPMKFYSDRVRNWNYYGIAEIGPGRIYNKYWGNGRQTVAELATDRDVTYNFSLDLGAGNYYLEFEWAPREGVRLSSSKIKLRWNGDLFLTLRAPFDSIFRLPIGFHSTGSENTLSFTGAGDKEDTLGATITNLKVYETINHFKDGFANFGNMQAMNLFYNREKFTRTGANIMFIFDFQPRAGYALSNSTITVLVDDRAKLKVVPNTYRKRREFFKLKIPYTGKSAYTLKFRDPTWADVVEDTVTNVQVYPQINFIANYEILDFPGMSVP